MISITVLRKSQFLMKKIYLLTLMLVLSFSHFVNGQEPDFSMYQHTPFYINPGMIGVQEDINIMLNYRNQSVDVGENFTTSSVSAFYPIHIGNHRLAFGASFLSDKASRFVKTNGAMLGIAYSVNFSKGMEISLGMQGGFFQRRLDSDFTTDDQFVNGAFDPNAPSSETLFNLSRSYPTLSSGLYWQWKDDEGRQKAFAGGALFNYIEPNISFVEDGNDGLPSSFKANVGYRIYQGRQLSVMPTARWISNAGNNVINAGSMFRYDFGFGEQAKKQVGFGLWYNSNQAGIVSLEYQQTSFVMAASYDFPLNSTLNTAQNGGVIELAITYRIKRAKRRSKRPLRPIVSKVNDIEKQQEFMPETVDETAVNSENELVDTEDTKAENEVIEEERAKPKAAREAVITPDVPKLSKSDQELLSQTVKFQLESFNLTNESETFLANISTVLKNNDWLNVLLVGHSCDLGPSRFNEALSLKRAGNVQKFLVGKGILSSRLEIKGEGDKLPLDTSGTKAGREKNRRVEFKILD